MIYLYLFGTCFHFIYVFMIIGNYLNINNILNLTHNFEQFVFSATNRHKIMLILHG